MPEAKQSVLAYLKQELFPGSGAEFMREWKSLSEDDKSDLKAWAQAEMDAK